MSIKNLKTFVDERGVLLPLEFKNCPFKPERVFYVYGVPRFMRRGCHAHYKTSQFILCLSGEIRVGLHNGEKLWEGVITPGQAVHIETMVWDYQDFLTGHDVLAVLCSTAYNPDDYIMDFDEFRRIKNETLS